MGVLGIGIGFNYRGFQSANSFLLNLLRSLSTQPLWAIRGHMVDIDFTTPKTAFVLPQVIPVLIGELTLPRG